MKRLTSQGSDDCRSTQLEVFRFNHAALGLVQNPLDKLHNSVFGEGMGWRGGGDRRVESSMVMIDPVDDAEARVRVHGRDVILV